MKQLLVIAYHFYPDREIGAVRSVKFAKYLPGFGWHPVVLTVNQKYYNNVERDPLGFQCEIHRTSKLPVLDDIYMRLKSLLLGSRSAGESPTDIGNPAVGSKDPFLIEDTPLWKRIIFSISSTPDDNIGWLIPGAWKAIKLIRTRNIEAIYSSGSPWTCHLIGLTAKIITGKKWVADFRDPWIPLQKPPQFITGWSRIIERWMESKVVLNADLVLTATYEHRDDLIKRYSPALDRKCSSILNGFDDDDYRTHHPKTIKTKSRIEILYAGNLYFGRDPSGFLEVLGIMINEKVVGPDQIRIDFYGDNNIDLTRINEIIRQYNLENIVHFNPSVSKERYLDLINNGDILILMQSLQARNQIPAKTYEYLATGNHVIALVPEGATSNLLSSFENVSVVTPTDKAKIRSSIDRAIQVIGANKGRDQFNEPKLRQLTKRHLTETFAVMLDKIVSPEADK